MLKARSPFIGEIVSVTSPSDPDVTFGIKRVGNREVMIHRDRNAVVRYIQRTEDDEFISEKDYPVGSMTVDTVALCLATWNLATPPPDNTPLTINRESILSYLTPEEVDFLYTKCLEVNPILGPGGREARKNDSGPSSGPNSEVSPTVSPTGSTSSPVVVTTSTL